VWKEKHGKTYGHSVEYGRRESWSTLGGTQSLLPKAYRHISRVHRWKIALFCVRYSPTGEREKPRSRRVEANQGFLGAPVSSDLTGKREYIGNKIDLQTIVLMDK
jgi:hypothetical protein